MAAFLKRVMDLALALLGILVTAPIWLAIGIGIRLTSPGPVFYASPRAGTGGKPFLMYKFRTMSAGADRLGPAITVDRDPRVTSVGRVLRATKLDELPQLLNVVRGDMSLVGPRPEAPEYVALYDHTQRRVLDVRPGITGPTQLLYRHEERILQHEDPEHWYRTVLMPRKLESDLEYIRTASLAGDIRLIVATIVRLFHHR